MYNGHLLLNKERTEERKISAKGISSVQQWIKIAVRIDYLLVRFSSFFLLENNSIVSFFSVISIVSVKIELIISPSCG